MPCISRLSNVRQVYKKEQMYNYVSTYLNNDLSYPSNPYDNFIPKSLSISITTRSLFVRSKQLQLFFSHFFLNLFTAMGSIRYTRLASSLSLFLNVSRRCILRPATFARATFPGSRHDGEIDQRFFLFMLDALSTIARDNDCEQTAPGTVGEAPSVKLYYIISREADNVGKEPGNVG